MANANDNKTSASSLPAKCFTDLIADGHIRIPKIQRDYAQGRTNDNVNEIRKTFVHQLGLVVNGLRDSAELDFVYGSQKRGAFEPLDGQQRLTTLFLLHWILGVELNDEGESMLAYDTRTTSLAFCNELVKHRPEEFISELKMKLASAQYDDEEKPSLSSLIRRRDWFQWRWKFDPTISSMLVMIDTLFDEIDWTRDLDDSRRRLNSIRFNHLDLGELGMSDELFIKMNARGKQLSDFDKMKSTIEEELQLQQQESSSATGDDASPSPLATPIDESDWRSMIDGRWIDLFWKKYAAAEMSLPPSDDNDKRKLRAAKLTEEQLKKFLLRMIAMQIFVSRPSNVNLLEQSYHTKAQELNSLLSVYQDSLLPWRNIPERQPLPDGLTAIRFRPLITSINNLIVNDNSGELQEITALLPPDCDLSPDSPEKTYLDHFLDDNAPNDVTAIFYAITLFLNRFPAPTKVHEEGSRQFDGSAEWLANFTQWVRSCRNLLLNNNNNQRIDKLKIMAEATMGITQLSELLNAAAPDIYGSASAVNDWFASLNETRLIGIDNNSLAEEVEKALLRKKPGWEKEILEAEKIPYLWGQIRSLLRWADGDVARFTALRDRLRQIVSIGRNKELRNYYVALLMLQPDIWRTNNSLYEFNQDRDNSYKRHLRDKEAQGGILRFIIGEWEKAAPAATFETYCADKMSQAPATGCTAALWEQPDIIWETWRKRIFDDNGHVIFAQQKTTDSHCFDPVMLSLKCFLESSFPSAAKKGTTGNATIDYQDSKGTPRHTLKLLANGEELSLRWGDEPATYLIDLGEQTIALSDIPTILDRFKAEAIRIKEKDGNALKSF